MKKKWSPQSSQVNPETGRVHVSRETVREHYGSYWEVWTDNGKIEEKVRLHESSCGGQDFFLLNLNLKYFFDLGSARRFLSEYACGLEKKWELLSSLVELGLGSASEKKRYIDQLEDLSRKMNFLNGAPASHFSPKIEYLPDEILVAADIPSKIIAFERSGLDRNEHADTNPLEPVEIIKEETFYQAGDITAVYSIRGRNRESEAYDLYIDEKTGRVVSPSYTNSFYLSVSAAIVAAEKELLWLRENEGSLTESAFRSASVSVPQKDE